MILEDLKENIIELRDRTEKSIFISDDGINRARKMGKAEGLDMALKLVNAVIFLEKRKLTQTNEEDHPLSQNAQIDYIIKK